jgi:uncharacterized membrane protein
MKNKLLKSGIIFILVGLFLIFIPFYLVRAFVRITPDFNFLFIDLLFISGFFLLFGGIVLIILGIVIRYCKKTNVFSKRNCPKCGRKIQFEARVCPFCKTDFEED